MNINEREECKCGHMECEGVKYWQIDPFAEEIYNETIWKFMCDGDAYESAMDI
jgi:hypothetical protein